MLNFMTNMGMPQTVAQDCLGVYELFLVQGASRGIARSKVCELFSPPRITEEMRRIPNFTIQGGSTYDRCADRNGKSYDFMKSADRKRVRQEIATQKPFMVIGSPPCTPFISLRFFNKGKPGYAKQLASAKVLLRFAAEIYRLQLDSGRHFLHEHLVGASSWGEPCMRLSLIPI